MLSILYVFLLLIAPSIGIFIYKKIAEPISSYIIDGDIKIEKEKYSCICGENERLITEINKLQDVIKKKGDK